MSTIEEKLGNLTPEQKRHLLAQLKSRRENAAGAAPPRIAVSDSLKQKGMDFSLIFFSGNGSTDSHDKYDLLIECARFADENGFSAIVTPERHFQPVGGLFPNPAVLSAALAMVTKRIQLRAGSVIVPLHNPLRVAEEWSIVDNLSKGRAAISCATGWHPADFLISPEAYESRREIMFENLDLIRRLWRGESVLRTDVSGAEVDVKILPKPVQRELPVFITSSGNPATWHKAGELGLNVLCSLTNHSFDDLEKRISEYRQARSKHGFDADSGIVSVMVHTYVGTTDETVKAAVRQPLRGFLNSYIDQNDTLNPYKNTREEVRSVIDNDREALLSYAFEKHFNQTSLMGSPAKCARTVERLHQVGANEVACLVDFGLGKQEVLAGLHPLAELMQLYGAQRNAAATALSGIAA